MVEGADASGGRRIAMRAAWATMPLVLAAYVYLRYFDLTQAGLVFAQVVFLAPPFLATFFCGAAAYAGPRGNRERRVWTLLAASCGFLAIGESIFSVSLLTDSVLPAVGIAYDAASGAAVVCYIAYLLVSASLDRIAWQRVMRHVFDSVALLALCFALLHRAWSPEGIAAGGEGLSDPLRISAYALIGVIVLSAELGLLWVSGVDARREWDALITAGICVFSFGLLLWPAWGVALSTPASSPEYRITADTLFLVGYYLLFLGGLSRTLSPQVAWREALIYPYLRMRVWPGVVTSTLVMGVVLVLGYMVITVEPGTGEARVLMVSLMAAVASLVGRTALASAEVRELRDRSATDLPTGAYNMREFDVRITERLATQRRFGQSFAVYAVDLDEFSRLNAARGPGVASAVLAQVVTCMDSVHPDADVFRQAGDEFLLLAAVTDVADATELGASLLSAIRALNSDWIGPSASIGFALCPDHGCDRDELLRMASGARAWVKHHGRGRVMCYDERLVRSFGLEDRLRLIDERARRDMTRALAAAADARDAANARHSRNVAALSILLAEVSGLDEQELRDLEVAAMLHDVGKIALPDPMLGDRTLSIRERVRAREHSELGERLLTSVGIDGVAQWVRSHHERWDGEGYPDGLSGEEIPLQARIIALADAYDGMTTGKRYGAPMSKAAALQEIDLGLGTRFDPVLGESFIALVGRTEALGWSDDWPTA